MRYGYARVSTKTQERDGNSLESQVASLKAAGCDKVVTEAFTGTKMDRPKFTRLVDKLKAGDTLVVCKVDRFARTLREGLCVVEELMARGVSVHILNLGLLEDTPNGRLMLHMWLAFAQFERDSIMERTQSGKEIARQRVGYKEGRPSREIPEDFEKYREMQSAGEISVRGACVEMGISTSQWYKWTREMAG